MALAAGGQYHEVLGVYEEILRQFPDDRTTRFNLAVALTRLGRLGDAERVYRDLLAGNEDFLEAQYNLASLYQSQGRLGSAAEAWRKVVAAAPDLFSARTALGDVLAAMGDAPAAMRQYAEAAKLRPRDVPAWLRMATAARNAGSCGRAVVAVLRAARLMEADGDRNPHLAAWATNLHHVRTAERECAHLGTAVFAAGVAAAQAAQEARLWRRIGEMLLDLHRRSGRKELLREAAAAWRRALQLHGGQDDIRQWLETYRSTALGSAPKP
jgi:tetratricopeptide (TPR) repeat protein